MERNYRILPSYLDWTAVPYRIYKNWQRNRPKDIPNIDFKLKEYLVNSEGLQRTNFMLKTGGIGSKDSLRVLFYGQSITRGLNSEHIIDQMQSINPGVKIIFDNKSIGGFTAKHLVRTLEHDVIPFRPDLIVFHVYGGVEDRKLEGIFHQFKTRTTAEVLIYNHHLNAESNLKERNEQWLKDDVGSNKLQELCFKYGFALLDIRSLWKDYLKRNPEILLPVLMKDAIHPNRNGNYLIESAIISAFSEQETAVHWADKNEKLIHEIQLGKGYVTLDSILNTDNAQLIPRSDFLLLTQGKLEVTFTGFRIELISPLNIPSSEGAKVKFLIDGKPLSEWKKTYFVTRPSRSLDYFTPALKRVNLVGTQVRDEYELIITFIDHDKKEISYEVFSKSNGFEGNGSNQSVFESKSGRIRINPSDFYIFESDVHTQSRTSKGFKINWKVQPYIGDYAVYSSKNTQTNDIFELSNKTHKLSIELIEGSRPFPISAFRIYSPHKMNN
jgi:hypothetical protein